MLVNYKDIVLVDFAKSWETETIKNDSEKYEVEIHEMRERFGNYGTKETQAKPLCVGVITKIINPSKFGLRYRSTFEKEVGKEIRFDFSYIKNVVQKAAELKNFPKINIHRHNREDFEQYVNKKNRGIICGPLKELCRYYLGQLNEDIQVNIDYQKLKNRVITLTGILDNYSDYIYTVKRSHFERWFKRNWRHLLRSKSLENKLATEQNIREEREYADDDYFKSYERE